MVPYNVHFINIGLGDQFDEAFLRIAPNNRIPAIVDPQGPGGKSISIFESGVILMYLARKFKEFYPQDERKRVLVEQWLMWQMGGFGPMLGQNHHFSKYAPDTIPYAIERYKNETRRLYNVLDTQLKGREFIADIYSIADIATIGWAKLWEGQGINIEMFPNVKAWLERLLNRPAVQAGLALAEQEREQTDFATDEAARYFLFNNGQKP